jgi:hypothetical protein
MWMRWEGRVTYGGNENHIKKPSVKRLLRRPRRKCNDNIKANLNEIGCEAVVWSHMTRNRGEWKGSVKSIQVLDFKGGIS